MWERNHTSSLMCDISKECCNFTLGIINWIVSTKLEYELRASRNASREQEVFSRTIWVWLAKNPIKEFVSHNIRYRNTISSITRALLASSPTVSVTGATIDILATTQARVTATLLSHYISGQAPIRTPARIRVIRFFLI